MLANCKIVVFRKQKGKVCMCVCVFVLVYNCEDKRMNVQKV